MFPKKITLILFCDPCFYALAKKFHLGHEIKRPGKYLFSIKLICLVRPI